MAKVFRTDWTATSIFDQLLGNLQDNNLRFLEIGSFEGLSTCYLLDHWPKCVVVAIDPCDYYPIPGYDALINPTIEKIFRDNVAEYGDRVDFRKAHSADVLPYLESESFDFIYVDGDHRRDAVYFDGVASFRLLKVGAILLFDDYCWNCLDRPNSPYDGINKFLTEYASKIDQIFGGRGNPHGLDSDRHVAIRKLIN